MRPLLPRATVLYLLLRALATAAVLGGRALLDGPVPLEPPNPAAIIVLTAILGEIDIRRRRETLFWANLGYSSWHRAGTFAAIALAGEIAVFVVALVA